MLPRFEKRRFFCEVIMSNDIHEQDLCECGDYRRDHVGGKGECRMPDDLSHGYRKCKRFKLSIPRSQQHVQVHIYSHPDWDAKLILEADGRDREQAIENLGDSGDPKLLQVESGSMSRNTFELLPEWDG